MRSRRKTTPNNISIPKEAKILANGHCRKCGADKALSNFYDACDPYLDAANGKMSICKSCQDLIYQSFFSMEKMLDKALLRTCRCLTVAYTSEAVDATRNQLERKEANGNVINSVWGIYMKNLRSLNAKDARTDFTFSEPAQYYAENPVNFDDKHLDVLQNTWGKQTPEDYAYLERKYSEFEHSHPAKTFAQRELGHRLVLKLLAIDKEAKASKPTGQLEKEMNAMMEELAISPKTAKIVGSDASQETLGKWIEQIEREEPAEWLKNEGHEMYYDVGDVEGYFQKYFVRPLRNAILQSKDFNVDEESEDYEEYDSSEEELESGEKS